VRNIYILRLSVNSEPSWQAWKWISKNDPDSVVAKNVFVKGIGDSNSPPEAWAPPEDAPQAGIKTSDLRMGLRLDLNLGLHPNVHEHYQTLFAVLLAFVIKWALQLCAVSA
jgi:hypothetical protein